MNKGVICVDVDGTLTDPYFFVPYLNKITGKNLSNEDYTSVDWNVVYGEEFKEEYSRFDLKYSDMYLEAKPVEYSVEGMDILAEKGYKIVIVTARHEFIGGITRKWLDKCGYRYDSLFTVGSNENKIMIAEGEDAGIIIEDDPNNAVMFSDYGFLVYLIDTNYNRSVEGKNIIRVYGWREIVEKILED